EDGKKKDKKLGAHYASNTAECNYRDRFAYMLGNFLQKIDLLDHSFIQCSVDCGWGIPSKTENAKEENEKSKEDSEKSNEKNEKSKEENEKSKEESEKSKEESEKSKKKKKKSK